MHGLAARCKRRISESDERESCVGTVSGVAAVYKRHDFLTERREALDLWGAHVDRVLTGMSQERRIAVKIVA